MCGQELQGARNVSNYCTGHLADSSEFARSGYDSSDVKEQPDFPGGFGERPHVLLTRSVIFTKRASSIVADGTPIYPHPGVTSSLDYEGELAIIIGTGGLGIKREDAWQHVWGACIVNDFTARERQRDHKQFYIGKSLDTFCPMVSIGRRELGLSDPRDHTLFRHPSSTGRTWSSRRASMAKCDSTRTHQSSYLTFQP